MAETAGPHGVKHRSERRRADGTRHRTIRNGMNMLISTEAELDERLSRPIDADAAALAACDGDLIILGVGGKMGPSLAKLARRACEQASVKKRIIAVARFSDRDLREKLESDGIETIASDLLEPDALGKLPDVPNVIFMAARQI